LLQNKKALVDIPNISQAFILPCTQQSVRFILDQTSN